ASLRLRLSNRSGKGHDAMPLRFAGRADAGERPAGDDGRNDGGAARAAAHVLEYRPREVHTMTGRRIALSAVILAAVAAVCVGVAWDGRRIQPPALNAAEADRPGAATDKDRPPPEEKERAADRDAVRAAVKGLVQAVEKGDARALAGLWTEEG